MKPKVVIGFLGTQLDAGRGAGRWEKWRPSVSLGMHEDFLISRIELLADLRRYKQTADQVCADIAQVSPETTVTVRDTYIADPWDFESVYSVLHELSRTYAFDTDAEDYYVHITTGTHVAQICWFLLTEARFIPGRLLQLSPPRRRDPLGSVDYAGTHSIIDLDRKSVV